MNREIKFRAKNNLNEWVYGYVALIPLWENYSAWKVFNSINEKEGVPIDPKTLGQYTGIKDKNGKEIYDGDIVVASGLNDAKGEIIFERGCFLISPYYLQVGSFYSDDLEVIGNIYENKELLEDD